MPITSARSVVRPQRYFVFLLAISVRIYYA